MNELREEIELPESSPTNDDMEAGLDIAHNTPGCYVKTQGDCNFAARLAERERQLKSSLAANREHERQFSEIQDSIVATLKDFERTTPEHFTSQIRFVCSYYRGAMDTINALDAAKKELEAANREQKAQLLDRDNHIDLAYKALGDVNRSVYLFDHIREQKAEIERLKEQLNAANSACEEGGEIVGELASVGEKWIEIKKGCEMPMNGDRVLVCEFGTVFFAYFQSARKSWIGDLPDVFNDCSDGHFTSVTHWMPMVAPPTLPTEKE